MCALAGAFCYSDLGINFPSSGGEYVDLTEAFGPIWGFMTGWVSVLRRLLGAHRARGAGAFRLPRLLIPAGRLANSAVVFRRGNWAFRLGGAQASASVIAGSIYGDQLPIIRVRSRIRTYPRH